MGMAVRVLLAEPGADEGVLGRFIQLKAGSRGGGMFSLSVSTGPLALACTAGVPALLGVAGALADAAFAAPSSAHAVTPRPSTPAPPAPDTPLLKISIKTEKPGSCTLRWTPFSSISASPGSRKAVWVDDKFAVGVVGAVGMVWVGGGEVVDVGVDVEASEVGMSGGEGARTCVGECVRLLDPGSMLLVSLSAPYKVSLEHFARGTLLYT